MRFGPPSEKTTVDPRVDEVVLRMLEKERERRTKSAGGVKTQVETSTSSPNARGGSDCCSTQAGPVLALVCRGEPRLTNRPRPRQR